MSLQLEKSHIASLHGCNYILGLSGGNVVKESGYKNLSFKWDQCLSVSSFLHYSKICIKSRRWICKWSFSHIGLMVLIGATLLFSLYLLSFTIQSYSDLSTNARVAGIGPSIILAATLLGLFGFLGY